MNVRLRGGQMKLHRQYVFEVLVEAWTFKRKTEQKGLKRTRNEICEALKEVDQKAMNGAIDELPISSVKQYGTAQ
ncbi:hypothetical protein H5410_052115 [Solanum commersonii]|uniref:Uncharacterized protein n=1 Tax=Solanum commersonii TaxID=4109 RepID=A0A9J5X330_SOLCO|nr:hypothetical protein H5410_052115 [Solanum commersonii]